MARAALVVALALGVGALTPPPAPKTPVTGRQAVVKERKQLLPPTVAPLVVDTTPEGPLLADAPPLLDGAPLLDESGNNQGPPTLTTTTRPPPIPDELEDAVRKRSAEEQAEKAKQQIKIARSKKKGDWYKFGFQTKESRRGSIVKVSPFVPAAVETTVEPAPAELPAPKVTVPQDVDVLEFLGVTEPKPPCITEEEAENSVAKELAGFTLPLLLVWLASPLLSLVDTAAVGASRPTAELAVLGPACAACDNAAFLCTFLGIVTTGAVSRALATGDETKAKTASGAACVAALVVGGVLTAAACSPLGPAGLGAMVPRSTPGFSAAVAYTRIRSLAFVPALLIMVLQSTSLVRGPRPFLPGSTPGARRTS
jgi:hypothetical protein